MIETTVATLDFSTPPTIPPETSVTEAAGHLRRPGVPALAVREEGTVVGVLAESDVVALVAETDERPAVRDVMSAPATTVRPTATLAEAAEAMRAAGVRTLPVVDGAYRGVLSARTLGPYLSRHNLDIEWKGEPVRVTSGERGEFAASD